MVTCTQEIFGYCLILNLPKLARLAGERLAIVEGVGGQVGEVGLLEAAESSNVLR